MELVELFVDKVFMHKLTLQSVVALNIDKSNKSFLVYIGIPEAIIIASKVNVENCSAIYDSTLYSIFKNILNEVGSKIKRIIINEYNNNKYSSIIEIEKNDGSSSSFNIRLSDAFAVAVFAKIPIFTYKEILDRSVLVDSDYLPKSNDMGMDMGMDMNSNSFIKKGSYEA